MTIKFDKVTREALIQANRETLIEAYEMYNERWVTGAELCKECQQITKDWLENFGWKLPRERITVTGDDGKKRVTRWGYPLLEIKRMIKTGKLRDI